MIYCVGGQNYNGEGLKLSWEGGGFYHMEQFIKVSYMIYCVKQISRVILVETCDKATLNIPQAQL